MKKYLLPLLMLGCGNSNEYDIQNVYNSSPLPDSPTMVSTISYAEPPKLKISFQHMPCCNENNKDAGVAEAQELPPQPHVDAGVRKDARVRDVLLDNSEDVFLTPDASIPDLSIDSEKIDTSSKHDSKDKKDSKCKEEDNKKSKESCKEDDDEEEEGSNNHEDNR